MENRIIKFRGLSLNGEWSYGNLAIINKDIYGGHPKKGSYISNSVGMPFAYPVRPETVGQFTELTDRNGKLIFEGDIVRGYFDPKKVEGYLYDQLTDDEIKSGSKIFIVDSIHFGYDSPIPEEIEVIGNVHQDKNLIK